MAAPKLRFKEFDGEWNFQLLGNMAEFVSGYAFDSEKFGESGRKLITPKNFTIFGRALFTQQNTKYTTESCDEKFVCRGNDLLVLLTDLTQSCELLGKPVLLNYVNEEILLNQRILKIQPNENVVNKSFLLNYFLTENYLKHIKETSTGTTVRHSSNKILAKQTIFYPSIEEQTKIATFLSAVDEKISQLTQKHELLSQYKQGMMQKLFSQQIRFKADDGSEFGEWALSKLANYINEFKSTSKIQDEYEVLTSSRKGLIRQAEYFEGSRLVDRENIGYNIIQPNQITYRSRSDDGLFFFNLNRLGITGIISTYYPVFTMKNSDNRFFHEYLNFYKQEYVKYAVGTSQLVLSLNELRNMKFKIPCLEEQTKIANFLSAIDQKLEIVAQQIDQAKQWKKGLLQQMFV